MLLHDYLAQAAARNPEGAAVVDPGVGSVTYAELDAMSDTLCALLQARGVQRGDRVGVVLHKSVDSVASIYGILKAGAAYVPVDADGPMTRAGLILRDSGVRALFAEAKLMGELDGQLSEMAHAPAVFALEQVGAGAGLAPFLSEAEGLSRQAVEHTEQDLAYMLYTSGSTGRPKGAMITHENSSSFVDWAHGVIEPSEKDAFSAHAPFHFDLSILDLYVSCKSAAKLVIIGEGVGRQAGALGEVMEQEGISIWYSAPTILRMLVEGGELDRRELPALRTVIFAGEVYPIDAFRELMVRLPKRAFFNFYGPTETNVCTYYRVPDPLDPEVEALPIGKVCENLGGLVVDLDDKPVKDGEEGELWITGPNVMQGYFQLEERNAIAFQTGPDGKRYYRTGDLVVEREDGELDFRGRRDRMVKRRGYRVELGEIEACLNRHPEIAAAAVTAHQHAEKGLFVAAHMEHVDGGKLSGIKLRKYCAEHLPPYMIPDAFRFMEALPQTSTHKIDYQRLAAAEAERSK